MAVEYEVRVLEISVDSIIQKIEKLGATRVGSYHQKRYVYDYNPVQKGRWIRLRSNGIKTTLTLKEIKSLRIAGTSELEIVVSDFDETNRILNKLGYTPRSFQENYRIEYAFGDITFDIDKWPGIPTYLEIEATSEDKVLEALKLLDMTEKDSTTKDVDSIYNQVYNIVLDDIEYLHFEANELEQITKY